jgi:DnaK suppressor protein
MQAHSAPLPIAVYTGTMFSRRRPRQRRTCRVLDNEGAVANKALNLDHFRRRLLDLEKELTRRLGQEVETARSSQDDQFDAGDLARADELKEAYFTLADTDSTILAHVRDALRRIEEGTYGTCGVDGEPIDPKRLESVPWTPYCLKHQLELEARERVRTPSA